METPKIKALLFDYGGTLDTNARHWARVLWEGYESARIPVSEEQFRAAYVFGERALAKSAIVLPSDTFDDVLRKKLSQEFFSLREEQNVWNVSDGEASELLQQVARYCYHYASRCIDASRRVLQSLKDEGYRMALVSNFYGNINAILQDFCLPFFESVIESAVVGVRKPNPAIWQIGIDALGLPPSQIAVVGDSVRKDILPAAGLGCRTIWLKGQGWTNDVEDASLASAVIADIALLPQALHTLERRLQPL